MAIIETTKEIQFLDNFKAEPNYGRKRKSRKFHPSSNLDKWYLFNWFISIFTSYQLENFGNTHTKVLFNVYFLFFIFKIKSDKKFYNIFLKIEEEKKPYFQLSYKYYFVCFLY